MPMWRPAYQGAASSPPGPPPALIPGTGVAPSTGKPLPPTEAPHAPISEIAKRAHDQLLVPQPRMRQVATSPIRLDLASINPILGASGRARAIVITGGAIDLSSGRSTSLIQMFDGNTDTVATAWFDAYGGFSIGGDQPFLFLTDLDMPFVNGLTIKVTPQNDNFSNPSYFWALVYYESIPIGEHF